MADESDDLTERIAWDGRTLTATWLAPPFRPDPQLTTQVLGFCCTPDGQILLVTSDDEAWTLPGGHPEPGETFEATLERELREEGCARLVACEYLGCQRVDDPQRPEGPDRYYQVRYWARIELYPFAPLFGTVGRKLVSPELFLDTLAWGEAVAARHILAVGLDLESRYDAPLPRD
jgi:8-oxo-dGTP diphosphatase